MNYKIGDKVWKLVTSNKGCLVPREFTIVDIGTSPTGVFEDLYYLGEHEGYCYIWELHDTEEGAMV